MFNLNMTASVGLISGEIYKAYRRSVHQIV